MHTRKRVDDFWLARDLLVIVEDVVGFDVQHHVQSIVVVGHLGLQAYSMVIVSHKVADMIERSA
jgi:hypothetical protein